MFEQRAFEQEGRQALNWRNLTASGNLDELMSALPAKASPVRVIRIWVGEEEAMDELTAG